MPVAAGSNIRSKSLRDALYRLHTLYTIVFRKEDAPPSLRYLAKRLESLLGADCGGSPRGISEVWVLGSGRQSGPGNGLGKLSLHPEVQLATSRGVRRLIRSREMYTI